ncbi:MAG: helix-turn-helix domain-containing protein [Actinobacteria bacterium]|nr:MAG: helix-turn-helix domain-containing protein [Actinomycetota bacterium]
MICSALSPCLPHIYPLRYHPGMVIPSDIGAALVTARRSLGITQRELAERLGVAQPQVARWERAAYRTATLERVEAVARALGIASADTAMLAAETAVAYGAPAIPDATDALLARIGTDRGALTEFCRRHHVAELAVFGSALRADFAPGSDVDFLARFEDGHRPGYRELAAAEQELGRMLGRPVDLVERESVERGENHLRRRRILGSARVVFVA